MHFLRTLAAFSLLLLVIAPAHAQTWEKIGPYSANISDIAADPSDPNKLYAGVSGGIYRSEDGGDTWVFDNSMSPSNAGVTQISVFPGDGDIITAIELQFGLIRTTDGGDNWFSVDPPGQMTSFLVDPINSDIIYAGMSTGELLKSTDGGNVWANSDTGIAFTSAIRALAFDPTDNTKIYAAMGRSGEPEPTIVFSANSGMTWQGVTTSPSYPVGMSTITDSPSDISIDPNNPMNMLAVRVFAYQSSDGGDNWSLLVTPDSSYQDVLIDPNDSNILMLARFRPAGIYLSTNAGANWATANTGLQVPSAVSIIAVGNPSVYYIATSTGVHRSSDPAAGWERLNNGIVTANADAVAVHPTNEKIVYACIAGDGLYRTEDGGANWDRLPNFPDISCGETSIAPGDPATIYVANGADSYRTDDSGASWNNIALSFGTTDWQINPQNALEIYAVQSEELWYSDDGGDTILSVHPGADDIDAVTVNPNDFNHVLFARETGDVEQSLDGGMTWSGTLGTIGAGGAGTVWELLFHPDNPLILFAGTSQGVYRSLDGGATWTQVHSQSFAWGLTINPDNPNLLFRGSFFQGLFQSVDGGTTWTKSDVISDLEFNSIDKVVLDPNNRSRIYVPISRGLFVFGSAIDDGSGPITLQAGSTETVVETSSSGGGGGHVSLPWLAWLLGLCLCATAARRRSGD